MKKTLLIVALFGAAFLQKSFGQDHTKNLLNLLQTYYGIKNALVSGNASLASQKASAFVKGLDDVDVLELSVDEGKTFVAYHKKLSDDAREIAKSKGIKDQREHFAGFSANMYSLSKAVKLTTEPIYYDYCPMKKANWLTNEKAIKNPYYGSSMLTCGKVVETINQ